MIELIKDVRREHNVNVDMRIGVHTGLVDNQILFRFCFGRIISPK